MLRFFCAVFGAVERHYGCDLVSLTVSKMSGLSFGISGSNFSGSSLPKLQKKQQQQKVRGTRSQYSNPRHAASARKEARYRSNVKAAVGKPTKSRYNYGTKQKKDPNAPIAMERATYWTPEVEEAYRVQGSGWRSIQEYRRVHGDPKRWENGFVKMTVHPKTGYFSKFVSHIFCSHFKSCSSTCSLLNRVHPCAMSMCRVGQCTGAKRDNALKGF